MKNEARTDCHAPSTINPADYTFVDVIYFIPPKDTCAWDGMGNSGFLTELQAAKELIAAEGWKGGNYASKRTCDHCGAHFNYGAMYRHEPTNEIIVVGWICAEKTMAVSDRATLSYNRLVSRVHNFRKHVAARAALTKRRNDIIALHPDMAQLLDFDHVIVRNIKERFEATGYLSDKQMALVRKINAEPVKVEPTWLPVEEGRREVEGVVLAVKSVDSLYGTTLKMLVQIDREGGAEKLWVTVPSSLCRGDCQVRGKKVQLTCTIARSPKDATFGLGKRPSSARILA